jgi:ABC-type sulfate transport system permease subunit
MNDTAGAGASGMMTIVWLAVMILVLASLWRVYAKAGHPGWASLIPIYNVYVMLQIAGKPGWWLLMMFIPGLNVIFGILTVISFAKSFGKGGGFAAGLIFLPFIFYPILGFGDVKYIGAQE